MKNILILSISLILFSACKNNNNDPVPAQQETYGSAVLKFEHTFNDEEFILNSSSYYKTSSEDSLIFTTFKFYISNIQFKKSDGTIWKQKNGYYLIDYSTASEGIVSITVDSIPSGDYTDVTYTIGVDSTSNVSGAQSGALDPINGMFWSWNTGYIFLKAEGTYQNVTNGDFQYHIGGFKNSNSTNALQSKSFNSGLVPIMINPKSSPQIHFAVDVKKLFDGGTITLKASDTPTMMMPGSTSVNISKNYATMFSLEHVHN
ncbi:MAG: MbnP family protein [Cytophagaceae bacterium]